MSYKIAIASSDGEQIDLTFGAAQRFIIYEAEDGAYRRLEERKVSDSEEERPADSRAEASCESLQSGNGCGSGCGGGSGKGGCGGPEGISEKVRRVEDCRAIVCKKIGFQVQKQLERKAISAFDVECTVKEALDKITGYYNRMDHHESLRNKP